MIIAKIRKPFNVPLSWQPVAGWVWRSNVSIPVEYEPPSEYETLGYPLEEYNTTRTEIGQVYVDNVPHTQTGSLASCLSIEGSFFYDVGDQVLYVHPRHSVRLDSSYFDSLETRGYSNDCVFTDSAGIQFKPYLVSNITIKDEVDRGVYQKMSFVNNRLEFMNQVNYDGVGEFDYTIKNPVPGADTDIFYISEDDLAKGNTTLTPVYSGYAEADRLTREGYSADITDKRQKLTGQFPEGVYNSADYPLIDDKTAGEIIYEGYGELLSVPASCINGTVASGNVLYKYATDGTALDTVYVYKKDDEIWEEVTPTASDAVNCTFTLSGTDGRDSRGNYLKAKVDCTLRNIKNPSLIIADMITRYLKFPFNSDYFDFSTWSDESALLADISILLDKKKAFFEHIEPMQTGSNLPFIFRVGASGRFMVKVDDITRAVYKRFKAVEIMADEGLIETDFTQYATSVKIKYAKNWDAGTYRSTTIDTYKIETLNTYRLEKEIEVNTLLSTESQAEAKAASLLKDYKKARQKYTISIRGIDPNIGLFSVIEFDSSERISGECERLYAGDVKIKISSYTYDFINDMTTLTGYNISDIVSKGTEIYVGGLVNGPLANGDFLNGSTIKYIPEAG